MTQMNEKKILFREVPESAAVFQKDQEFENFLPPVRADQFSAKEAVMLKDGIARNPQVIWQGRLVSDYAEFEIATKHGLRYRIVELLVESKEEALLWLGENTEAQRHMNEFELAELRLKMKPLYEIIARKNHGKKDPTQFQPLNTLQKIADEADVGRTTAYRVSKILSCGDPSLVNDCRLKKKTINKAYNQIIASENPAKTIEVKDPESAPKKNHFKGIDPSGENANEVQPVTTKTFGEWERRASYLVVTETIQKDQNPTPDIETMFALVKSYVAKSDTVGLTAFMAKCWEYAFRLGFASAKAQNDTSPEDYFEKRSKQVKSVLVKFCKKEDSAEDIDESAADRKQEDEN